MAEEKQKKKLNKKMCDVIYGRALKCLQYTNAIFLFNFFFCFSSAIIIKNVLQLR
jgi:hypothetical protein